MVEGVFNIDKPAGLTSHDVVNEVRRITETRRVGHSGTLDPLATGVLLICVGRATRLVEYLVGQRKRYKASVRLGQETDTFDAEGKIVAEHAVTATRDEIVRALGEFKGEINQLAPSYSAIKVDGVPLYKRARRGETPDRPLRQVTIYELEISDWDSPVLKIDLTCSSGTYIRSIAHDLGQLLGCGGHLAELRRMSIGDFGQEDALILDSLNRDNWTEYILPKEAAVRHLPRVELPVEGAIKLYHGQTVPTPTIWGDGEVLRAYDDQSRFVGIVTFETGHYKARKILYEPST
jgi:tRNA pseudouridine55 synthase